MACRRYKDAGITEAEVDAELARCERVDQAARAEAASQPVLLSPRTGGYTAERLKALAEALAERGTVGHGSPCLFEDCGKPTRGRGLCPTHYTAARDHGLVAPARGVCAVEGCEKATDCCGLCRHHYRKWKRNRPGRGTCKVEGCERNVAQRGLCHSCYMKAYHKIRCGLATWGDYE